MKRIICIILLLITTSACSIFNLDNVVKSEKEYDKVFIITGDSRTGDWNEENLITKIVIEKSMNYTLARYGKIDGILLTGDYVGSGRKDKDWVQWIDSMGKSFDYPLFPCIGNHDDEHLKCGLLPSVLCYETLVYSTNYYKTFKRKDWWSEDVDDIHIISLSSNYYREDEKPMDAAQVRWLQQDLRNNTKPWTIVLFHAPAYSSYTWFGKVHGSDKHMRNTYVPILEEYGVDVIFNGHNHWAEVTVPILNNKRNEKGIRHITIGGGGAPLLPTSPFPFDKVHGDSGHNLSDYNKSKFHFGILCLDRTNGILKFEIIQFINNKVMYELEINNRG